MEDELILCELRDAIAEIHDAFVRVEKQQVVILKAIKTQGKHE